LKFTDSELLEAPAQQAFQIKTVSGSMHLKDAAQGGCFSEVKQHVELTSRAQTGSTSDTVVALRWAVLKKNTDIVSLILSFGNVDVNQPDRLSKDTLLHIAAQNSDLPTMQVLAAAGADMQLRNLRGETPLENSTKAFNEYASFVLGSGTQTNIASM
jgi:ankyrin repeat protein